jgi:hypothetical protein
VKSHVSKFRGFLSSPSFSQLKVLTLNGILPGYSRSNDLSNFVPSILDSLPSELKVLNVQLHCLCDDWFAYLASVKTLERVVWDVIMSFDPDEQQIFLDVYGIDGFPWCAQELKPRARREMLSRNPLVPETMAVEEAFSRAFHGAHVPQFVFSIDGPDFKKKRMTWQNMSAAV